MSVHPRDRAISHLLIGIRAYLRVRASACIELQLQRELDVVCVRTVHVVIEGVSKVSFRIESYPGGTSTRLQRDERLTHT